MVSLEANTSENIVEQHQITENGEPRLAIFFDNNTPFGGHGSKESDSTHAEYSISPDTNPSFSSHARSSYSHYQTQQEADNMNYIVQSQPTQVMSTNYSLSMNSSPPNENQSEMNHEYAGNHESSSMTENNTIYSSSISYEPAYSSIYESVTIGGSTTEPSVGPVETQSHSPDVPLSQGVSNEHNVSYDSNPAPPAPAQDQEMPLASTTLYTTEYIQPELSHYASVDISATVSNGVDSSPMMSDEARGDIGERATYASMTYDTQSPPLTNYVSAEYNPPNQYAGDAYEMQSSHQTHNETQMQSESLEQSSQSQMVYYNDQTQEQQPTDTTTYIPLQSQQYDGQMQMMSNASSNGSDSMGMMTTETSYLPYSNSESSNSGTMVYDYSTHGMTQNTSTGYDYSTTNAINGMDTAHSNHDSSHGYSTYDSTVQYQSQNQNSNDTYSAHNYGYSTSGSYAPVMGTVSSNTTNHTTFSNSTITVAPVVAHTGNLLSVGANSIGSSAYGVGISVASSSHINSFGSTTGTFTPLGAAHHTSTPSNHSNHSNLSMSGIIGSGNGMAGIPLGATQSTASIVIHAIHADSSSNNDATNTSLPVSGAGAGATLPTNTSYDNQNYRNESKSRYGYSASAFSPAMNANGNDGLDGASHLSIGSHQAHSRTQHDQFDSQNGRMSAQSMISQDVTARFDSRSPDIHLGGRDSASPFLGPISMGLGMSMGMGLGMGMGMSMRIGLNGINTIGASESPLIQGSSKPPGDMSLEDYNSDRLGSIISPPPLVHSGNAFFNVPQFSPSDVRSRRSRQYIDNQRLREGRHFGPGRESRSRERRTFHSTNGRSSSMRPGSRNRSGSVLDGNEMSGDFSAGYSFSAADFSPLLHSNRVRQSMNMFTHIGSPLTDAAATADTGGFAYLSLNAVKPEDLKRSLGIISSLPDLGSVTNEGFEYSSERAQALVQAQSYISASHVYSTEPHNFESVATEATADKKSPIVYQSVTQQRQEEEYSTAVSDGTAQSMPTYYQPTGDNTEIEKDMGQPMGQPSEATTTWRPSPFDATSTLQNSTDYGQSSDAQVTHIDLTSVSEDVGNSTTVISQYSPSSSHSYSHVYSTSNPLPYDASATAANVGEMIDTPSSSSSLYPQYTHGENLSSNEYYGSQHNTHQQNNEVGGSTANYTPYGPSLSTLNSEYPTASEQTPEVSLHHEACQDPQDQTELQPGSLSSPASSASSTSLSTEPTFSLKRDNESSDDSISSEPSAKRICIDASTTSMAENNHYDEHTLGQEYYTHQEDDNEQVEIVSGLMTHTEDFVLTPTVVDIEALELQRIGTGLGGKMDHDHDTSMSSYDSHEPQIGLGGVSYMAVHEADIAAHIDSTTDTNGPYDYVSHVSHDDDQSHQHQDKVYHPQQTQVDQHLNQDHNQKHHYNHEETNQGINHVENPQQF